jgi:hypothetical protein
MNIKVVAVRAGYGPANPKETSSGDFHLIYRTINKQDRDLNPDVLRGIQNSFP